MVRGRYSSSEPTSGTIGAPSIQTPSQAKYGLEGVFVFRRTLKEVVPLLALMRTVEQRN
jgi:hypothetical protein